MSDVIEIVKATAPAVVAGVFAFSLGRQTSKHELRKVQVGIEADREKRAEEREAESKSQQSEAIRAYLRAVRKYTESPADYADDFHNARTNMLLLGPEFGGQVRTIENENLSSSERWAAMDALATESADTD